MDFNDILGMVNPDAARAAREREEEEERRNQRRARGQAAFGSASRAQPGFAVMPAIAGPEDHARILGGMGKNIMAAFDKENTSRVSQSRELRRMQHEKELKAMELETLLRRIQAAREESQPKPRASGPGFAIY